MEVKNRIQVIECDFFIVHHKVVKNLSVEATV